MLNWQSIRLFFIFMNVLSPYFFLLSQVFITSHFDKVFCDRSQGVRLSVFLSEFLSMCLYLRFCHLYSPNSDTDFDNKNNFNQLSDKIFTDACFRSFWKSELMVSQQSFLRYGTLTVAIFVRYSVNLATRCIRVARCLLMKISKTG